jgi:hypothetical protein
MFLSPSEERTSPGDLAPKPEKIPNVLWKM